MNKFKFEIGCKIPGEIINKNESNSPIIAMLLNNNMTFIISDCQNEQDAKDFKSSTIKFSVCRKEEVLFFVIDVKKINLEIDAPYNINFTPNTKEDMEQGIKNIYIIFTDNNNVIRAMRGMELVEKTSYKLADMFIRQLEDGPTDMTQYNQIVNNIYKNNPKPSDLLKYEIMNINWKLPN